MALWDIQKAKSRSCILICNGRRSPRLEWKGHILLRYHISKPAFPCGFPICSVLLTNTRMIFYGLSGNGTYCFVCGCVRQKERSFYRVHRKMLVYPQQCICCNNSEHSYSIQLHLPVNGYTKCVQHCSALFHMTCVILFFAVIFVSEEKI